MTSFVLGDILIAKRLGIIMGRIRKLLDKYFYAPPRCLFCSDEKCDAGTPFCPECYPKYTSLVLEGCADCGAMPIDCSCVSISGCAQYYRLFNYEDRAVRIMIYKLKRKLNRFAFRFLAARLADMIALKTNGTLSFDCVAFVPREKKSRLYYGFDHAEKLAKSMAALLGVPCVKLLLNTGKGGEQKRLNRGYRGIAAKLRFAINQKALVDGRIPYKKILLIDDVVTTGASMGECAGLLKAHGAGLVIGASVAYTPIHGRTVF